MRGCSTPARSSASCYFALALWLLARTLDRGSWRCGALAGVAAGLIVVGRDQVALLVALRAGGIRDRALARRSARARACARASSRWSPRGAAGLVIVAVPVITDGVARRALEPAGDRLRDAPAHGSLHPAAPALMLAFADLFGAWTPNVDFWGPPARAGTTAFGPTGLTLGRTWACSTPARCRWSRCSSFGLVRGLAVVARDPLLHGRGRAGAALCARLVHAGVPRDVRPAAGRQPIPPPRRRDLRARRADRRHGRLSACIAGSPARWRSRRARSAPSSSASSPRSSVARVWLAATVVGPQGAIAPVATGLAWRGGGGRRAGAAARARRARAARGRDRCSPSSWRPTSPGTTAPHDLDRPAVRRSTRRSRPTPATRPCG